MPRAFLYLVIATAAYFAVQGGEWPTTALFKQRERERILRDSIATLQRDVDSLRAFRKAMQSDPVLQERVARERHGMVRGDKEIVFRFIDTAATKP